MRLEKGYEKKVTIGVCARIGASTLRRTMESIMQQDFPHKFMEVIFVDDGSEDDTLNIVRAKRIVASVASIRYLQ